MSTRHSPGRVIVAVLSTCLAGCQVIAADAGGTPAAGRRSAPGLSPAPPGDGCSTSAHRGAAPSISPPPPGCGCSTSALLVPSCGAWWGVVPGAFTDVPKARALARFEDKIGRTVDIVHFYHRGRQLFPTAKEIAIAREKGKRRLLFLDWKPEAGHTWAEVAGGAADAEIDRLAAYVKDHFSERFFLAIHHEPEEEVERRSGSGYTVNDYVAMFRHVVRRLRAGGVDNAVTVMTYMGAEKWGKKPWFDALYPGDKVVDWIAFDPFAGERVHLLDDLVNRRYGSEEDWAGFYAWARTHHPDKPLMLAEWGVYGQPDDPGHKAEVFRAVGAGAPDYPAIKAYVYFSSPNTAKGDTTIDTSKPALEAYLEISGLSYFSPPGP